MKFYTSSSSLPLLEIKKLEFFLTHKNSQLGIFAELANTLMKNSKKIQYYKKAYLEDKIQAPLKSIHPRHFLQDKVLLEALGE